MSNYTLVAAVAAAILASGTAIAQVKDGTEPSGPSNGDAIEGAGLPGFLCSAEGGTNCSGAIVDDDVDGVTSTFDISGCGTIVDVNIGVDISHTFVGDVGVTVAAPGQAPIALIDRPGVPASLFGCAGDDIFAVLDDDAASPVENECAGGTPTINGAFIPNEALSAFTGLSADGTWTLNAIDLEPVGTDEGTLNDWSVDVVTDTCGGEVEPQEPRATFGVVKAFADFNPMPVEVTLSCNTGLPLEQTTSLNPDPTGEEYIEFVVNDFADGELDCEVTEAVPEGYSPVYIWAEEGGVFQGEEGCFFENVAHGDFADTTEGVEDNICIILNVPDVSTVTVNKEWIDENPQFNSPYFAEATWFCSNLPDFIEEIILPPLAQPPVLSSLAGGGDTDSGNLTFIGNPGVDSFEIFGNWDGGTMCSVTEQVVEGGVEADDSDCQGLLIGPGEDVECTIVNTRLFEGIPTLSQYGLGLLALLMLGMGFVAYRRVV